MWYRRSALGLALLGLAAACGPSIAADAPLDPALTEVRLDVGGPRRFLRYVPPGLGGSPPRAAVVALHGGGGEGLAVSEPGRKPLSVFRAVAEREGLVVAWPEGLPARDGRAGWTDCRSDNRQAAGVDDVAFLLAVFAALRQTYGADLPIFLAGTSNGGQMALAFAAHAPETLSAIAVGAANLPAHPLPGPCAQGPDRPVPALFVHGGADPMMPFAGGCVADLGGGCARGRVVGAEATRDAWLVRNGLSPVPTATETIDVDRADAGPARRFVYAGPAPVEWWLLPGAGHPPPSRAVPVEGGRVQGRQNRDVEFAELAWAFFAARLPPERTLRASPASAPRSPEPPPDVSQPGPLPAPEAPRPPVSAAPGGSSAAPEPEGAGVPVWAPAAPEWAPVSAGRDQG